MLRILFRPKEGNYEEDNKRIIIEKYINGYNAFDIDAMMSVIHPEIEFVNISGGELNASASGMNEFRYMAEELKNIFHHASKPLSILMRKMIRLRLK